MMLSNAHLDRVAGWLHRGRGLALPLIAASLIFAVLVPLPPVLMDILLAANIALAAIILLTTIYVATPLDFSVFPTLLLGATLVRLVLNVATTRLILTAGADGRTLEEAQLAAGKVIWSFSQFVAAGSLEVGVILFAIIAIIQFVVITRGASRISEVAARFVLDAMPGKQMAIDADLAAGLIDEVQAHDRRLTISREADFYGAMDGASKFLRGDAAAAVIIMLVNISGGLYVGMVQYGWSASQTLGLFTRLTIGDGLVAQIPAFIVSISAALIVTRSTVRTDLGQEVVEQLTARPLPLAITAVFLGALAFTSLPKLPLLLLGAGCAGLALLLGRRNEAEPAASVEEKEATPVGAAPAVVQGRVEPLQIELGYSLVKLVAGGEAGDLLDRIVCLRRRIAKELGLVVPPVKIRDDMRLDCQGYVVKIRGARVGGGQLHPGKLLAICNEELDGHIAGLRTTEPTFGTPAVWIARSQRAQAEVMNYTVVEASAVLATHLDEIIRSHAAELLSRRQTVRLLDELRGEADTLVGDVLERFSAGQVQRVLQNLLQERVPVRDLETILEALCDAPSDLSDLDELTALVREAMRRTLTQQFCAADGKLWCLSASPSLEQEIAGSYVKTPRGGAFTSSPQQARRIAEAVAQGMTRLTRQGRRPVLLCDPSVRPSLRKMIAPVMPEVAVLGYNEVDTAEVQSVGSVGIE